MQTMDRRRAIGILVFLAFGLAVLVGLNRLRSHRARAALDDPNPAVRVAAIRDVSGPVDVELLCRAVNDPDADVRMVAVQQLGRPGPDGAKRAQALVEALKDQ